MMNGFWFRSSLLGVGLILGSLGCSSDGGSANDGTGGGSSASRTVEIYSWWVAPGEAEAWQALVDDNKRLHPNDRVFNAAGETGEAASVELLARLGAGDPPDLFQLNSQAIALFATAYPGLLQPLDGFLAERGLTDVIAPDILRDASADGHVYAMPLNVHRENALFYNKQVLADNGIEPPESVEALLAACKKLKAAGVTPLATVFEGWVLRILFNDLAMGSMGAESFHAFMTKGELDEVKFRAAIDVLDEVLQNYVNEDAGDASLGWTGAAEKVSNGDAAMFLHGDWTKGYYEQLGWTPGVDFGVEGAPGASEMFWYSVDTFAMPVGAPDPEGGYDFLATIGSREGQVAFNRLKGSTPVRTDIPRSELDSEGLKTFDDFVGAKFRTPIVNQDQWEVGLLEFATTHDKDALYRVYADNIPQ
jgi:glucose/mannose transport system substrate-binding protein